MFIRLTPLLLVAGTASSFLFGGAAASGAGSSDPLADLDRANTLLSQGKFSDAIVLYDSVIQKDKKNYLSYYKRALSYLGLHRYHAAISDLNAVLEIQPDFSAALVQRGKLFAWYGDYVNAIKDLKKARPGHELIVEYEEAHNAVEVGEAAEKKGHYQQCIDSTSAALGIATGSASLWQLRARCSLAVGDSEGAVGDLTQASKLVSTPEINILLSQLLFYSLNDPTSALTSIKKCLHQDPENKACKKEFRMLKSVHKHLTNFHSLADRKEWTQILTLLVNENLLQEIQTSHTSLKTQKVLNGKCPARLLAQLEEWACQAYAGSKSIKLALQHCSAALDLNPESIPALLAKSQILLIDEQYDEAIQLLTKANEVTGGNNREIRQQLDKAQRLLRQSKKRDYYKILGVPRDADTKAIKKAYREMSKKYHPDKYKGDMDADAVSQKMAEINSAYEVLSNEELRTRYDNGDDPNDHEGQQGHPGHPFVFQQNGQNFFFQQGQNPFQGSGGNFKFRFGF